VKSIYWKCKLSCL